MVDASLKAMATVVYERMEKGRIAEREEAETDSTSGGGIAS
jgi:hypothetical protein